MKKKKIVQVYLNEERESFVRKTAKTRDVSMSQVINEAIAEKMRLHNYQMETVG